MECRHLFQLEQATYQAEGIDWTTVEFEDNQECVDLIEARPPKNVGVLSLLDEQCVFPKVSRRSVQDSLASSMLQLDCAFLECWRRHSSTTILTKFPE